MNAKGGAIVKEITKLIRIVCLVAVIWIVVQTVADMGVTDFHIVNRTEYVRDGQLCILYRVTSDKENMTEQELIASFKKLIRKQHDGYYLHCVMVYSRREYAYTDGYDVANIEELKKGETPVVEFQDKEVPHRITK